MSGLEKFTDQMRSDLLNDVEKEGWKDKEPWWYLAQAAKDFNALDAAMTEKSLKDITKYSVSLANYIMITSTLSINTIEVARAVKDKATKKKKTKTNKKDSS